jgi:XTP/dITP diphosphohydrolase
LELLETDGFVVEEWTCSPRNILMMKDLVFATHNANKAKEVRALLAASYRILTLDDIGCDIDIPETGKTFAENAGLKTRFLREQFKLDSFGDDSGLEVEALNQEPGIFSARYSGRGDVANYELVLEKLKGKGNRKARFRTVISLLLSGEEHLFEGTLPGVITEVPVGSYGFGYDPIFIPEGFDFTLAEMTMVQKNEISHRAIAMRKLIKFLGEQE